MSRKLVVFAFLCHLLLITVAGRKSKKRGEEAEIIEKGSSVVCEINKEVQKYFKENVSVTPKSWLGKALSQSVQTMLEGVPSHPTHKYTTDVVSIIGDVVAKRYTKTELMKLYNKAGSEVMKTQLSSLFKPFMRHSLESLTRNQIRTEYEPELKRATQMMRFLFGGDPGTKEKKVLVDTLHTALPLIQNYYKSGETKTKALPVVETLKKQYSGFLAKVPCSDSIIQILQIIGEQGFKNLKAQNVTPEKFANYIASIVSKKIMSNASENKLINSLISTFTRAALAGNDEA